MFTARKTPMKIVVQMDGPYRVEGEIPLVKKSQVVTESGEPIAWKKEEEIHQTGTYYLCRCGKSKLKPFCDSTHCEIDFDGTERAPETLTSDRLEEVLGGHGIVVKKDRSLCMDSGFCGTKDRSLDEMVPESEETEVRSNIIAMIDRCPSGTYTYSIPPQEQDIEPDLPRQIADTTEITDTGPIRGPLWVTGNVPVERSDGKPFETRNRVTLCSCGNSKIKPLCDGTHRHSD